MTTKQLTATGQMWTNYLKTCTYAYNSFASPALNGSCPSQLIFGRPLKVLLKQKLALEMVQLDHSKIL